MKLCLLLLGCLLATVGRASEAEGVVFPPRLFFGLEPAANSPDRRDGYYLYFEDPTPYDVAIRIVAYEYSGGELRRKYSPGMLEEDYLYLALLDVKFESFDYAQEKAKVENSLSERQERGFARHMTDIGTERGGDVPVTVEIRLSDSPMIFTDSLVRHRIAVYALYSEKFKKLKRVLDLVAQTYGHSRLGI